MNSSIRHRWQQTSFSCGAAAVAMILDIPESEARKLAKTTSRGTVQVHAKAALESCGKPVHSIRCDAIPLALIGWALEAQSQRWPLYLSLNFPHKRIDSRNRIRTYNRLHAVVLYRGQLFDPGEFETLTIDTLGHLADEEVVLNGYLLVEID